MKYALVFLFGALAGAWGVLAVIERTFMAMVNKKIGRA